MAKTSKDVEIVETKESLDEEESKREGELDDQWLDGPLSDEDHAMAVKALKIEFEERRAKLAASKHIEGSSERSKLIGDVNEGSEASEKVSDTKQDGMEVESNEETMGTQDTTIAMTKTTTSTSDEASKLRAKFVESAKELSKEIHDLEYVANEDMEVEQIVGTGETKDATEKTAKKTPKGRSKSATSKTGANEYREVSGPVRDYILCSFLY